MDLREPVNLVNKDRERARESEGERDRFVVEGEFVDS